MKKIISISLFVLLVFILSGCGQEEIKKTQESNSPTTKTEIKKQPESNHEEAYDYCENLGYELIIRFDKETKMSKGFCRFPDGSECEVDKFFSEECQMGETANFYNNSEKVEINELAVCDNEYKPVCGKNGVNYTNECLAQIQGIIIAHEGVCTETELTTTIETGTYKKSSESNSKKSAETFSDLPPTVDSSMPSFLAIVKDFILSSPKNNPPAFIDKCNIGGKIYYFQSDGCTDCFSTLYTEDGNIKCYPSNDIDSSCPTDLNKNQNNYCTRLWTDNR